MSFLFFWGDSFMNNFVVSTYLMSFVYESSRLVMND